MVAMVLMLEGKGLEDAPCNVHKERHQASVPENMGMGMVKYCQQHMHHNIYLQKIQQKQIIVGGLALLH